MCKHELASEVDHIIPKSRGGTDDISNPSAPVLIRTYNTPAEAYDVELSALRRGLRIRPSFDGAVHVNPHKFRHTFATLAVTKFDPPWTVVEAAAWLGHTVQVFERTYRHAIPHAPRSGMASITGQSGPLGHSAPVSAVKSKEKWWRRRESNPKSGITNPPLIGLTFSPEIPQSQSPEKSEDSSSLKTSSHNLQATGTFLRPDCAYSVQQLSTIQGLGLDRLAELWSSLALEIRRDILRYAEAQVERESVGDLPPEASHVAKGGR